MDEAKDIGPIAQPPVIAPKAHGEGETDHPDPRKELLLELTRRLSDPTSSIRFLHGESQAPSASTIIDSADGKVHFSLKSTDERGSSTNWKFRYVSVDFLNETSGEDGGIWFSDEDPEGEYGSFINEDPASPEFIEKWKAEGENYRTDSKKTREASKDDLLELTSLLKNGHPNMEMLEAAFRKKGFTRLPAEKPEIAPPTPIP